MSWLDLRNYHGSTIKFSQYINYTPMKFLWNMSSPGHPGYVNDISASNPPKEHIPLQWIIFLWWSGVGWAMNRNITYKDPGRLHVNENWLVKFIIQRRDSGWPEMDMWYVRLIQLHIGWDLNLVIVVIPVELEPCHPYCSGLFRWPIASTN